MTATLDPSGHRLVTPLTELLGIDHPILLAPMGGAAGGRLAAAVSTAGGMGIVGGGYGDPAWLEAELDLVGDARVGIGFITFALEQRSAALDVAMQAWPALVQLSFGDPRPFADRVHAGGALLVCQVQSSSELELAVEAGADVIVAQGRDAGGHGRPDRGTVALVPSVVDRVAPLPVVAAGGIADGRGLAAMLALGAGGVVMGTRLLATSEAISTPVELAALVANGAQETVRTEAFDVVRGPAWPSGHDARALRNDLVDAFDDEVDSYELRDRFKGAAADDYSLRPVWAGEGLDLVTSIETARDVIEATVARAVGVLKGLASSADSLDGQ